MRFCNLLITIARRPTMQQCLFTIKLKVVLFTLMEYFNDSDVTNHHGFKRNVQNDQLFSKRSENDNLPRDYGKVTKLIGDNI